MTWRDITVEQYQLINGINNEKIRRDQSKEDNDLEKMIRIIALLFNKTETEVNNLPVDHFHRLTAHITNLFTYDFKGKERHTIIANGKRYAFDYEIGQMRHAQYVEAMSFLKDGKIIENLHLIAASITCPMTWYFKRGVNDSSTHAERANDFLQANFQDTYNSVVFFCALLNKLNTSYRDLFGIEETEGERKPEGSFFQERFGWFYSLTRIAELERISLNEAWDIPVIQALNDLVYLKEFDKHQEQLNKKTLGTFNK
jgi:hypothetical protein